MKKLNARETQVAIKLIKDYFERELSKKLNLTRVSAPLFVRPESGLNDDLTGAEKAVNFELTKYKEYVEIVQSLAKWKRLALKWYGFEYDEGIYTDMNAIRPDEVLDDTHSIYVDQWDWEKVIKKNDRNEDYLINIVKDIYCVFKEAEKYINSLYPETLTEKLPDEITFITAQELEDLYPNLNEKEKENAITKKHKAIFLYKIGNKLKSGQPHGTRSPDYDDWELNGDIIFWNPVSNQALELSSMGIRVDEISLEKQLKLANAEHRKALEYHKALLNGELPYTVGGGIGQSRICMFFLEKQHIGEVQASVWTKEIVDKCNEKGIFLL
ncbi:MAG: aspartate--ammonia ligase [Tissierellia bacterium]|jgi:aspartate--ammonia ligase|nr:aspartate--ammonia ligase [Tissierellia bacterium]